MTQPDLQAVQRAFSGAGFSRFSFATGFVLHFSPTPGTPSEMSEELRVDLSCDWILGDEAEWEEMVRSFPIASVEPSEPVQAAALAALRWGPRSRVEELRFVGADVHLHFGDRRVLATRVEPSMDGPAWCVSVVASGRAWSVASEAGRLEPSSWQGSSG